MPIHPADDVVLLGPRSKLDARFDQELTKNHVKRFVLHKVKTASEGTETHGYSHHRGTRLVRTNVALCDATSPSKSQPLNTVVGDDVDLAIHQPSDHDFRPSWSELLRGPTHNDLPPFDEVVEGCKVFTSSYYQLGFIAKALFMERLANGQQTSDLFYYASILSVSARLTPCLVRRYGSGAKATEHFVGLAIASGLSKIYTPSVENCQAFFMLALAEWGSGDKSRSSMNMGVAVRMAGTLGLHLEETYTLSADATGHAVIDAEVARRTFWIIQGQECLHAGPGAISSFSLQDITALLPCDERDFAFGIASCARAALDGTAPAQSDAALCSHSSRSLFAALIQVQNLWSEVARYPCSGYNAERDLPWNPQSYYYKLSSTLRDWERGLAPQHRWSVWNLRGYKVEGLHLGYLSLVMVLRLCNIVIRRWYLKEIISALVDSPVDVGSAAQRHWAKLSEELFHNVFELDEQITAFNSLRGPHEGSPTEIVFCVYMCGSLATHLRTKPLLCPELATSSEAVFSHSMELLKQIQYDWPVAQRWYKSLRAMRKKPSSPRKEATAAAPPSSDRDQMPQDSTVWEQLNESLPLSVPRRASQPGAPRDSEQGPVSHARAQTDDQTSNVPEILNVSRHLSVETLDVSSSMAPLSISAPTSSSGLEGGGHSNLHQYSFQAAMQYPNLACFDPNLLDTLSYSEDQFSKLDEVEL
ncbi:hypothetical protein EDD36DRAFT_483879 [Exophiala viscosa]|uniref:Xylanolytic transcriptional activator regulatory domain-containing protein n=1 Tax=Exophiala viscosa TaxID=2486360 RepID=A0AAN6IFX9_9EURO|nr:hypothetical protein EDD36DRAFT_483879 [Exophiala viscosa]